jgi:hypothetical protein
MLSKFLRLSRHMGSGIVCMNEQTIPSGFRRCAQALRLQLGLIGLHVNYRIDIA